MTAKGELPYGLTLDLPDQYTGMTGTGELWVRDDGLPLREIINAHFPRPSDKADYRTDMNVTVDFYDYPLVKNIAPFNVQTGIVDTENLFTALATHSSAQLSASLNYAIVSAQSSLVLAQRAIPFLLALIPVILLLFFLTRVPRSRIAHAVLVVFVIFAMEANPLMQTAQASVFVDEQRTRQAAQEKENAQQDSERELREKLATANRWDPQRNVPGNAALRDPVNNPPPAGSTDAPRAPQCSPAPLPPIRMATRSPIAKRPRSAPSKTPPIPTAMA